MTNKTRTARYEKLLVTLNRTLELLSADQSDTGVTWERAMASTRANIERVKILLAGSKR